MGVIATFLLRIVNLVNLGLALLHLLLVFGRSTALLMFAEIAHQLRRAFAVLARVGIVGHVGEHMRTGWVCGGVVVRVDVEEWVWGCVVVRKVWRDVIGVVSGTTT
jgi:hypothetical protein